MPYVLCIYFAFIQSSIIHWVYIGFETQIARTSTGKIGIYFSTPAGSVNTLRSVLFGIRCKAQRKFFENDRRETILATANPWLFEHNNASRWIKGSPCHPTWRRIEWYGESRSLRHFLCPKMANEAARLHFTRRQPLFTQKAQPFLHIFTKHLWSLACLSTVALCEGGWSRALWSLVKRSACAVREVFSLPPSPRLRRTSRE